MKKLIVVLALMLLSPMLVWAVDMHVYAEEPVRSDLQQDEYRAGILHKGDIASCWPHGSQGTNFIPGYTQGILLRVNDMTLEECQSLMDEWAKNIDYTVVNHDTGLDGYRIDVFALVPGVSQYGNITQAGVESFLTEWNGIFQSASQNNVRFDISVYELAISNSFWEGNDVSAVVFSEDDYDEGTGVHTIRADYSLAPFAGRADNVAGIVEFQGGAVLSDVSDEVVFTIERLTVLGKFKKDIKEKVDHILWSRRWYVNAADTDTVLAADNYMEISRATFDAQIEDRTIDP